MFNRLSCIEGFLGAVLFAQGGDQLLQQDFLEKAKTEVNEKDGEGPEADKEEGKNHAR